VLVLAIREMGVDGDQPVMKGESLGLGRKVLEVVYASGAEMPEDGPEMSTLPRALFDDIRAHAVMTDSHARVDFEGIKIMDVLHPLRVQLAKRGFWEMWS
jgi:hypothetical protein